MCNIFLRVRDKKFAVNSRDILRKNYLAAVLGKLTGAAYFTATFTATKNVNNLSISNDSHSYK